MLIFAMNRQQVRKATPSPRKPDRRDDRGGIVSGRAAERGPYLSAREIAVTRNFDRGDRRAVNRNHIKSRDRHSAASLAMLVASRVAREAFLPFARGGFYISGLVDVRNWRKERNCRCRRVRSSETSEDDGIIEKVTGRPSATRTN